MQLLEAGINHETAGVELREKLAFSGEAARKAIMDLNSLLPVEGLVILDTCNRLEVYMATQESLDSLNPLWAYWGSRSGVQASELKKHFYTYSSPGSFAICSGWLQDSIP